jgi:hypothetical protein
MVRRNEVLKQLAESAEWSRYLEHTTPIEPGPVTMKSTSLARPVTGQGRERAG